MADEASLAAALRTFGKARVPPGTVIRLTRTLLLCEKDPKWGEYRKEEDYHCECRRLRPRRERKSAGGRREG